MREATLPMVAALAFAAGVVFSPGGWRDTSCPPALEVVRYYPVPEVQPIYPAPTLIKASDLPLPTIKPEGPSVQSDDPAPAAHHRRRHRRHWRHR